MGLNPKLRPSLFTLRDRFLQLQDMNVLSFSGTISRKGILFSSITISSVRAMIPQKIKKAVEREATSSLLQSSLPREMNS
jgi:hypothetical protein